MERGQVRSLAAAAAGLAAAPSPCLRFSWYASGGFFPEKTPLRGKPLAEQQGLGAAARREGAAARPEGAAARPKVGLRPPGPQGPHY